MKENKYTNIQLTVLVLLRLTIGWHMLYEGTDKLLNPQWSALSFLRESQWILKGFAQWLISDPTRLNVVDFLNTWGLIAIGLGLILGLFCRTAAVAGSALLLVYFLNCPPIPGLEYTLPADGSNLFINKTLIEAIALLVLAVFPGCRSFGLDSLLVSFKKRKGGLANE